MARLAFSLWCLTIIQINFLAYYFLEVVSQRWLLAGVILFFVEVISVLKIPKPSQWVGLVINLVGLIAVPRLIYSLVGIVEDSINIYLLFGVLTTCFQPLRFQSFSWPRSVVPVVVFCSVFYPLTGLAQVLLPEISFYPGQQRYKDKVVYEDQNLVVTKAKSHHWFYVHDVLNITTYDHFLYTEPFVYPVTSLVKPRQALVLGGENGLVVHELEKLGYRDIDWVVSDTGVYHSFRQTGWLAHPLEVNPMREDISRFLSASKKRYDLILVDLPDPLNDKWSEYYSVSFYEKCYAGLSEKGMMITQSCDPILANQAFEVILNTMVKAGFYALPLHNQIPTLGEWSWIIGSKIPVDREEMIEEIEVPERTRWLNEEALGYLFYFPFEINIDTNKVHRVDSILFPELYHQHKLPF